MTLAMHLKIFSFCSNLSLVLFKFCVNKALIFCLSFHWLITLEFHTNLQVIIIVYISIHLFSHSSTILYFSFKTFSFIRVKFKPYSLTKLNMKSSYWL